MRAVLVRIYLDLEEATGRGFPVDVNAVGHMRIDSMKAAGRISLDKFFVVTENDEKNDDTSMAEYHAERFCAIAMKRGIRFTDNEKTKSTRWIPAKYIVSIFQSPCYEITEPEGVKGSEKLNIEVIPHWK